MTSSAGFGPAEWIQLVIAALTGIAAVAALWSARASKRASEAELFSSVIAQYGSPDMLRALQELEAWHREGEPGFTTHGRTDRTATFHETVRGWAELRGAGMSEAVRFDQHRRRVAHFFALAAMLIEDGKLSKGFADGFRRLLGKELYLDVVLPMELALREERGAKDDDGGMRQLQQIHRVFFPGRMIPRLPAASQG